MKGERNLVRTKMSVMLIPSGRVPIKGAQMLTLGKLVHAIQNSDMVNAHAPNTPIGKRASGGTGSGAY